jgi:hypothetical protein
MNERFCNSINMGVNTRKKLKTKVIGITTKAPVTGPNLKEQDDALSGI